MRIYLAHPIADIAVRDLCYVVIWKRFKSQFWNLGHTEKCLKKKNSLVTNLLKQNKIEMIIM